jgi:hypothetical protein
MTSTAKERDDLLLEIAHCKTMHDLLADRRAEHSYARIVHDQRPRENGRTQLPEPWNGNLGAAPLLFVSSNPSISRQERCPETSWPLQDVSEFFYHRFGDSPAAPIQGGCMVLNKDGSRSKAVPFLSWARGRAAELGVTRPGIDYALTEVVHCKSKKQVGVAAALSHCASTYTRSVLKASGAKVVVFVGAHAANAASELFELERTPAVQGPLPLCGKSRMVAFLPHPNSHLRCKFKTFCEEEDVGTLCTFLN